MAKLSKRAKGAYFVVVAILICFTHIYIYFFLLAEVFTHF